MKSGYVCFGLQLIYVIMWDKKFEMFCSGVNLYKEFKVLKHF
jgi:hypothetical protein